MEDGEPVKPSTLEIQTSQVCYYRYGQVAPAQSFLLLQSGWGGGQCCISEPRLSRRGASDVYAHLQAFLPAEPEVPPGEEADHSSPGEVADPAFFLQLGHDGVYPGKARPTLRPLGHGLGVLVPGDLDADGVALHLVKVGVIAGGRVEELPHQKPHEVRGQISGLLALITWIKTHIGLGVTKYGLTEKG